VVFMDLVMPRVDGEEAIRRMRADERLREVPVVVVSARDMAEGTMTLGTPLAITCREPLEIGRGARCMKAMLDALSATVASGQGSSAPSPAASDDPPAFAAPELRPEPAPDEVG
jgi:CheY-like chemotaxis protein